MQLRTTILLTTCLLNLAALAQTFNLRKENDSLYWVNDWRLPYPVISFRQAMWMVMAVKTQWWGSSSPPDSIQKKRAGCLSSSR